MHKQNLIWVAVLIFCAVLAVTSLGAAEETEKAMKTETPVVKAEVQDEEKAASASDISIKDATICRDVIERAPVEPGDVYHNDVKKLYCYTRVVGVTDETEITHNWFHKGDLLASVSLPVKSANWRTYSSKSITPDLDGEWKVEIVTKDGELLEKIFFLIK